jgi:hypothetical protein
VSPVIDLRISFVLGIGRLDDAIVLRTNLKRRSSNETWVLKRRKNKQEEESRSWCQSAFRLWYKGKKKNTISVDTDLFFTGLTMIDSRKDRSCPLGVYQGKEDTLKGGLGELSS